MYLQGFSQILQTIVHVWGAAVEGPGPVHGPWAREKPTLGTPQNCESSPRCPRMPLQRVIFPDIDLPKMHYNAVGSLEASHWTIMHLGEVNVGKNGPL